MKIKLLGMAVLASMVLVSGPFTAAFAEEFAAPLAAQKAVRGLTNAGLGVVVEVPKTVYYGTLEDGPLYGLTVGVLEGLSWGIARTLVGVYEVVTFPFPIPEGYRSNLPASLSFRSRKDGSRRVAGESAERLLTLP